MPKIVVNPKIVENTRLPEIDQKLYGRYMKITKAYWAELYFDLVREAYGEGMSDEEIMQDAENRLNVLKFSRKK